VDQETERLWEDSMPEIYDRYLGPAVFMPQAVELAKRAGVVGATRVLELAAGTGVLTGCLRKELPIANVTATDFNQAMVDYGAKRIEDVAWQQADAQDLPFEDCSFDLVACQFGVMFFPDKPTAFREVARVLAPGGQFLFNTWDALERNDFEAALVASLTKIFPVDPPTFLSRIPHGYTDLARVSADLTDGGLRLEDAATVTVPGYARSAEELAVGFCHGTPLRMEIEKRGNLDDATKLVSAEMTTRLGAGPVTGTLTAYLVVARKET
jgi:SAM-dependent methyltransferase